MLMLAAAAGHAGIARRLIEAGAALEADDALGNTALHLAAAKGHASHEEEDYASFAAHRFRKWKYRQYKWS